MNKMWKDLAVGGIRHVLTTVGGVLVASGYIDDATAQAVIGGVMALVGFGWSALDKYIRDN